MKNESFTIIDGNFTNDEAMEILMTFLTAKINFHYIKNLNSIELFGYDDIIAQKRIPVLKESMKKIKMLLSEAKAKNKKVVVRSDINISFLEIENTF